MPSAPVDGMNPETVHEAMEIAVDRARKGEGPTLLEIITYRYKGHSMSDPAKYRTKEEVENYKTKDPVETSREKLLSMKWATEAEIEAINSKVIQIVEESVKFADESPYPEIDELYKDVYSEDYPYIMD